MADTQLERNVEAAGLRGLADRVEALGGRLDVSSEQGRGTTVRAELQFPDGVATWK